MFKYLFGEWPCRRRILASNEMTILHNVHTPRLFGLFKLATKFGKLVFE